MNDTKRLKNFIPINRDFFEHKLWKEKRVFSKAEAWLYIIKETRFEDSEVLDGNVTVLIKRGQLYNSIRFYAEAWGWSTKKVGNFLIFLEKEEMIKKETVKETGQTIITVCNYDIYNNPLKGKETLEETVRKQQGNSKETKSNIENKVNKENNIYTPIIFEEKERLVFISLIPVMNEILEDQSCIEDFQISAGSPYPTRDEIKNKIKEFFIKLTVDGERTKDRKSAIYHFKSWISREIEQKEIKQDQLNLGVGEFIKDGKRYYGKQRPVEVPMNMPPRPSDRHYFNLSLKQWNV